MVSSLLPVNSLKLPLPHFPSFFAEPSHFISLLAIVVGSYYYFWMFPLDSCLCIRRWPSGEQCPALSSSSVSVSGLTEGLTHSRYLETFAG